LDQFWNKRGYFKHPELKTTYSWKDLDEAQETPKPRLFGLNMTVKLQLPSTILAFWRIGWLINKN